MIDKATDSQDPRLDAFRWRERQLANRLQRAEQVGAGMFVAEGDLVVERALDARCQPVMLLCEESFAQHFDQRCGGTIPVFTGSPELRKEVTGLGVPLDVVGLFQRPARRTVDEIVRDSTHVLVLEEVDNPTNVGAIVRSAAALGWDGLIIDSTSADPLARRALRVSMGTGLALPFARTEPGAEITTLLHQHRFTTIGLTPDPSATDIARHRVDTSRVALVFGSERSGLSTDTRNAVSTLVRIPMHSGVDSLNVGAAAAIALHAFGPDSAPH